MTARTTTKRQEMGNNNNMQESVIVTQGPRSWKDLALHSLAQLVVIIDTSIIGVALPAIQQQFGFSHSDLQCVSSIYVIGISALLPLGWRLSGIFGERRILVIGFAILTAPSVLAGLAPNERIHTQMSQY
jgi:MFS family permease